jgi:hypothetical protein
MELITRYRAEQIREEFPFITAYHGKNGDVPTEPNPFNINEATTMLVRLNRKTLKYGGRACVAAICSSKLSQTIRLVEGFVPREDYDKFNAESVEKAINDGVSPEAIDGYKIKEPVEGEIGSLSNFRTFLSPELDALDPEWYPASIKEQPIYEIMFFMSEWFDPKLPLPDYLEVMKKTIEDDRRIPITLRCTKDRYVDID